MDTNKSKKILTVLSLVGALSIVDGQSGTVQAVQLDQFDEPDAYADDEQFVQIDVNQESNANTNKRPADSKKLQTKDEDGGSTSDLLEALGQTVL